MFEFLIKKLKAHPRKIVFTEGTDPRILEASARLLSGTFLTPVLVGNAVTWPIYLKIKRDNPALNHRKTISEELRDAVEKEAAKKQRSAQDERMLELLSGDESFVSPENLSEVLQWYREGQL